MAVIAVTNYKGGVGKTTSTINLAAALNEAGKRTLVVDFDPQANLTIHAGFKDVEALGTTLSEIMRASIAGQPASAASVDQAIRSLPSGVDLLPCNHGLVRAEEELARVERPERVLDQILARVRNRYDFVVVDCLPGAGLLSTNALTAADYAIVPVQAEYLAMQGLAYLLQYVAHIRASYNPRLQILGVLMTMVDLRTLHSREVLEAIRKVFQTQIRVFYSMVKVDVKLRESSKAGQSILDYAPSSKGAMAYRSLAQEVLAILPDYEDDPNRGTLSDPEFVANVVESAAYLELGAMTNGHTVLPVDGQPVAEALGPAVTNHVAEPEPVPAADENSAAGVLAAPVPVVACPKLGFASQPGEHASEPHADHCCFAMREPLTLGVNRQRTLCLSTTYKQCPLYLRYSLISAEEARKQRSAANDGSLKKRLSGAFRIFSR